MCVCVEGGAGGKKGQIIYHVVELVRLKEWSRGLEKERGIGLS